VRRSERNPNPNCEDGADTTNSGASPMLRPQEDGGGSHLLQARPRTHQD